MKFTKEQLHWQAPCPKVLCMAFKQFKHYSFENYAGVMLKSFGTQLINSISFMGGKSISGISSLRMATIYWYSFFFKFLPLYDNTLELHKLPLALSASRSREILLFVQEIACFVIFTPGIVAMLLNNTWWSSRWTDFMIWQI